MQEARNRDEKRKMTNGLLWENPLRMRFFIVVVIVSSAGRKGKDYRKNIRQYIKNDYLL